ncbi:hypothetical protein FQN54_007817 [Arachnomyces sp. PD_36]|nr:hypothetical protein FQN54_007817 [Arachnomyces sp. PD_36]
MSPSHTFHVYKESGGRSLNVNLLDNDDKTPAYRLQYSPDSTPKKKRGISIIRLGGSKSKSSSGTIIGTISHHSFSSKLDFTVQNHSTTMEPNGTFKTGGFFTSTFPGAGVLTWEKEGMFSDHLVLVDRKGTKFARYAMAYFSSKKLGKLEILMRPVPQQKVVDEIVVSGLAVLMELNGGTKGSHHRSMGGFGGGGSATG